MIDEVSAMKISEFPKAELRRVRTVPLSEIEAPENVLRSHRHPCHPNSLDFQRDVFLNSTTYTADLGSLSFSAVSIKLMIANAAAADPLPPWRILLREAWRHERSRPFFGRITSLCFRGLLFPRHIKSDFHG